LEAKIAYSTENSEEPLTSLVFSFYKDAAPTALLKPTVRAMVVAMILHRRSSVTEDPTRSFSAVPSGLAVFGRMDPALACRAIVRCPSGTKRTSQKTPPIGVRRAGNRLVMAKSG
jgi:hypothetical protein